MSKQKETLVTKKYAEALASQVAGDRARGQKIIEDLALIKETIAASDEFKNFLLRPGIKLEEKIKIVTELFADKIDILSLNTLKLLIKKRRTSIATEIHQAYQECFFRNEGIEKAHVYSAAAMDEASLSVVKQKLEKIFHKEVLLTNEVDEELLAGSKIKLSGKVIDSSLKSKINKMKQLIA